MTQASVGAAARPPLRWIILKIHQRCNLNCSYCYVYNRGDDSWKSRPKQISNRVLDQVCKRISKHCAKHDLDEFVIELHGGEPMLVGKARFVEIVTRIRQLCAPVAIKYLMQTNGTLLDLEWCKLFEEHGISVGVSVDGPADIADLNRYYHNGRGSTNDVLDRLRLIKSQTDIRFDHGCLAVVDPRIPGDRMIDWFVENDIMFADLLLPLGNIANPPDNWTGPEPYTEFMTAAFDRWFELDDKAPAIRLFETMIRGHFGSKAQLDALGGDLGALCVVETNGAIGISDVIRLCGGEIARDTISVFDTALDEHVEKLDVDLIQEPCVDCKACPEFKACGGGYLPHRFDGTGFDNRSIYCQTLYAMSERARDAILATVPRSMIVREGIAA